MKALPKFSIIKRHHKGSSQALQDFKNIRNLAEYDKDIKKNILTASKSVENNISIAAKNNELIHLTVDISRLSKEQQQNVQRDIHELHLQYTNNAKDRRLYYNTGYFENNQGYCWFYLNFEDKPKKENKRESIKIETV